MIDSFARRFNVMKKNQCHIQYVLDIGAYRGDFTTTIKSVWPTAIVRQFEADERQLPWLQSNAIIALLGDVEKEVDFYTLDESKITTGSSIFKELTPHYTNASTIVQKKRMTTLDILHQKHNFFGNWNTHGLIKIDTQGSELLILAGAKNFLEKQEPRFILLECSVAKYNQGAPVLDEVIREMSEMRYLVKDIFDLSYDNLGTLLQTDILFELT